MELKYMPQQASHQVCKLKVFVIILGFGEN
jgi:hypothetical protein